MFYAPNIQAVSITNDTQFLVTVEVVHMQPFVPLIHPLTFSAANTNMNTDDVSDTPEYSRDTPTAEYESSIAPEPIPAEFGTGESFVERDPGNPDFPKDFAGVPFEDSNPTHERHFEQLDPRKQKLSELEKLQKHDPVVTDENGKEAMHPFWWLYYATFPEDLYQEEVPTRLMTLWYEEKWRREDETKGIHQKRTMEMPNEDTEPPMETLQENVPSKQSVSFNPTQTTIRVFGHKSEDSLASCLRLQTQKMTVLDKASAAPHQAPPPEKAHHNTAEDPNGKSRKIKNFDGTCKPHYVKTEDWNAARDGYGEDRTLP
ncbi:hypothetical protein CC80DRAFT_506450 [Byssothecium circinans]|uniref:Uncharacterized protein n=1 Tax=Byssothecium circinans TaxID=147558 RepID=A0A6A5TZR6_9PLEO|nr:hypothetical protein CC80DRAFT_506450 [Byssothecium circinans]